MAMTGVPTPRADEKVVAIIEIPSPEGTDAASRDEFDKKFTAFKQELDRLVTANFAGAVRVKMTVKKSSQGTSITYTA